MRKLAREKKTNLGRFIFLGLLKGVINGCQKSSRLIKGFAEEKYNSWSFCQEKRKYHPRQDGRDGDQGLIEEGVTLHPDCTRDY